MSTTGVRGGASEAGEEEMEDHVEMEQDSTSNVVMFVAGGTFIPGTVDNTVTETPCKESLPTSCGPYRKRFLEV
jgi:hypothetical protein